MSVILDILEESQLKYTEVCILVNILQKFFFFFLNSIFGFCTLSLTFDIFYFLSPPKQFPFRKQWTHKGQATSQKFADPQRVHEAPWSVLHVVPLLHSFFIILKLEH